MSPFLNLSCFGHRIWKDLTVLVSSFILFLLVILVLSISGPSKWFNFLFYRTFPVNVLSKDAWHMVNFESVFWRNTKVLDCVISRRTYKLLTLPFDGRQCSDFLNFLEYVPWKPIITAFNYSISQCLIKTRNLVKFKNVPSVVQGHFHSIHFRILFIIT